MLFSIGNYLQLSPFDNSNFIIPFNLSLPRNTSVISVNGIRFRSDIASYCYGKLPNLENIYCNTDTCFIDYDVDNCYRNSIRYGEFNDVDWFLNPINNCFWDVGESTYIRFNSFIHHDGDLLSLKDSAFYICLYYVDFSREFPEIKFPNCSSSVADYVKFNSFNVVRIEIIGAIKIVNGDVYALMKDHMDDDNWIDFAIKINPGVYFDYFGVYNEGSSGSYSRTINNLDHNIVFLGLESAMASDDSILALKDSLDCICTAVNSVSSRISSASTQSASGFSSIVSELDYLNSNFCSVFNDTVPSGSHLGVGSVFKKNFNNSVLSFSDLFSNAFLSGNNLDKSVFRTLLNVDYSDSFSSAFNLLSGVGSVFANNAINPVNYRSIYDDFHDSFYNSNCGNWFIESFNEAFNLTNCQGSVFRANDNVWNDEDSLAGIWFKQLDFGYIKDHASNSDDSSLFKAFYSYNGGFWDSFSKSLRNSLFDNNNPLPEYSVFKVHNSNYSFSTLLRNVFTVSSAQNFNSSHFYNDNHVNKILNHSCLANPCNINFCDPPSIEISSGDSPIEISSGNNNFQVDVNLPEDDFGEAIPFKVDWKPLLNLLSEALFCQFGNNSSSPRSSWSYSVFNKFLYPNNTNDCDDKVGLPELDFSDGFVPDNIFVNSNGLVARFNSEIYK